MHTETGAQASGSSLLELEPATALPCHADSAEETIVVISGTAEVTLDDGSATVGPGEVALIPADALHKVRNIGDEPLRFAAVYAVAELRSSPTARGNARPSGEARDWL